MTENPVSLSHIDPQLAALDHAEADTRPNDGDNESGHQPVEAGDGGGADSDALEAKTDTANDKKKAGGKRKKQTARPALGSTADYKRKEANRLAAERSRSRQSEKKTSLNETFNWLKDANARLRAEIARLEQDEGSSTNEGLVEAVFQQQQQQQQQQQLQQHHNQSHQGEGSSTTGGEGLGEAGASILNDAMDAEAEAQAHSRTILAALMSDAEINQALGEHWMDHVDTNEIESGHSIDQTSMTHHTSQDVQAQMHDHTVSPDPGAEGQGLVSQTPNPQAFNDVVVEQPKSNVMGVALHAEMERHIRDDLASTKAAIDQIEKELTILRAGPDGRPTSTLPVYVSPLPPNFTSNNPDTLTALLASLEADMSQTTDSTILLRETTAIELRDSRISEAERLQDLISHLKIDEADTAAVGKILNPLKSHLIQLIDSLTDGSNSGTFSGSRLAAAIAPRRRGRPARVHSAAREQERNRKQPDKQLAYMRRNPRTRPRPRQVSKLAKELTGDEEASTGGEIAHRGSSAKDPFGEQLASAANDIETVNRASLQQHNESADTGQTSTNLQNSTQHNVEVDLSQLATVEADAEADNEPEMTTEQIISQLTHDEQDLHDLLRSHAQAEYDAQQATDGMLPSQFTDQGIPTAGGGTVGVDGSSIDQPGTLPGSASGSGGSGELSLDATLAQQIRALHQPSALAPDEPIIFGAGPAGSCDICQRTQTTVWRKLRLPDRDLHVCNPCGMYHIKTGQIRPRELWGDGKLIRKRRKSTHPKGFTPKPESTQAGANDTSNKRFKIDVDGSQIALDLDPDLESEQDQNLEEEFVSANQGEGSSSHHNHNHNLNINTQQRKQFDQHQQQSNSHSQEQVEEDHQSHELEDVVGHEDFRATLGMEGLGEMITGFSDHENADVDQHVVNVFGDVQ